MLLDLLFHASDGKLHLIPKQTSNRHTLILMWKARFLVHIETVEVNAYHLRFISQLLQLTLPLLAALTEPRACLAILLPPSFAVAQSLPALADRHNGVVGGGIVVSCCG